MAKRQKQSSFGGKEFNRTKDSFGGDLLKNSNAKTRRPLDSRLPIHLVLRAKKSVLRLPKNLGKVSEQVERSAKRHGVKIYKFANVGNHLHFVLKIPKRENWAPFIRELTGRIAQLVANEKGFWAKRPFTRIVRGWHKAFRIALEYVELNWLESQGFISRKQTKTLKDLRAIWSTA